MKGKEDSHEATKCFYSSVSFISFYLVKMSNIKPVWQKRTFRTCYMEAESRRSPISHSQLQGPFECLNV